MPAKCRDWQAISSIFFGAEIRNAREPNRESVWVHNVVTVRTDKVAGQCAMPYTPFRCAKQNGD